MPPKKTATGSIKGTLIAKKLALKKTIRKTVHRKRVETWSIYIFCVLKQVHPYTSISKKAIQVMNSFITDMFERITLQASKLVSQNKKRTLTHRDLQAALRLVLNGELTKHALSEGTKSIIILSNATRF
ncbi:hypothetical protein FGO68_gene11121 [Halteria grandinella]|uniref:Core Histone H2A/H2B/H3 domain-containing protein n=1 Tax=Halteria grandinella TaxID=5974 RepID=A0A8J8NIB8_HALGN|nr:hypothetical protein FGO68_gene11121 [Halteria grandinella]